MKASNFKVLEGAVAAEVATRNVAMLLQSILLDDVKQRCFFEASVWLLAPTNLQLDLERNKDVNNLNVIKHNL